MHACMHAGLHEQTRSEDSRAITHDVLILGDCGYPTWETFSSWIQSRAWPKSFKTRTSSRKRGLGRQGFRNSGFAPAILEVVHSRKIS